MRYEILGPVRITAGKETPSVGTHKVEVLLRTLLIRNGHILSLDQLATELWGDRPPIRARASIHVYVSQLRKVLNRFSRNNCVITTRAPGYMLELGGDELDLELFVALAEKARLQRSVHRHDLAVETLTEALRYWREPVQASSYKGPIIREFANWAEELRVECTEMLARSLLASDQSSQAVRILYGLIAEFPLREKLYAFLMEALSQSGRRADALEVYQTARRQIREELGLEPCRFLRETQEIILRGNLDELSFRHARHEQRVQPYAV
ncbi:AfsR/SARP family transcriptional regulator [Micromonospora carbonacea]|uniref:AfsR/SARP family transcriptional regulator n=1 Tax=Micromonospora carbonacea TaxID=47853 RepID=A0A7H8XMS4_9ACTN|nr:AfsR/SARP family transcriptional regulator [Micromonospora carbonacea]MBB5825620.1 DNA-binding SARP family transcriptional activator [Micromonospora carbonacea]QLD26353.1 AfsR/SARP family transcriptional regulator [Micromonospora carbonacea]